MKYRWDWVTPIAISPHDHNRVYVGAQVVFMTTDGGQSWKVISPDLTRNDKSHQQNSGGITADNLTTFDGATLYAIAESPVKAGVIWTGSDDGQVQRDAGRRRALDERHEEHPEPAAVGHGVEHRAVALRRGHAPTSP